MSSSLILLEEALDIGRKELESLSAGDVDSSREMARRRGELMAEAWKRNDAVDVTDFMSRLKQLKALQGQLTVEAKRLQSALKQDLAKAKQENKRLSGYHKAVKTTPLYSRYVSKQG